MFRGILSLVFGATFLPQASFAHTVLAIGDSHSVGSYGAILSRLFVANGHRVRMSARKSSTPRYFLEPGHESPGWYEHSLDGVERSGGPTNEIFSLEELVREVNPDLILIQQGSNLLRQTREQSLIEIREMAQALRTYGRPCFWVGAPHGWVASGARFQELNQDLTRELSGVCFYIDSTALTHYPRGVGDGLHYDRIMPLELVAQGVCTFFDTPTTNFDGCADGVQRSERWARYTYLITAAVAPALYHVNFGTDVLDVEIADLSVIQHHGAGFIERYITGPLRRPSDMQ